MSNDTAQRNSKPLIGLSASAGIGFGTAVVLERPDLTISARETVDPSSEQGRLHHAFQTAAAELARLTDQAKSELGQELAHILRSQQTLAEDESMLEEVAAEIIEHLVSAEEATRRVFERYHNLFEELADDAYNKQRVADLDDVGDRILRTLLGVETVDLTAVAAGSVIVASDLSPSETATMPRDHVSAIVTEHGGITSHVAILAKGLGIPAAVGVAGATGAVASGQTVALDASEPETARFYVAPDKRQTEDLERKRTDLAERQKEIQKSAGLPSETTDGRLVTLSANIGSRADVEEARKRGAESVGLYRTEFLFMQGRVLPDEETQYRAYREAAEAFSPGMVIFRTLDVGGDKDLPALEMPAEENPFLGRRAIRISLARPELLLAQLRAVLRASAWGTVKLMFPMVSSLGEIRKLTSYVNEAKESLDRDGFDFDGKMETGIMVEVPSAVLMAPEFAKEVDFFSIGTNDLTQYLLAADRLNEGVREYYASFHPALFRAIQRVVEAAHREESWVGVCGELGGNPLALPILLGLGVDELSMAPSHIAQARHLIRSSSLAEAEQLSSAVLRCETDQDVLQLARSFANRR